jgi:hypothetical protein
MVGSERAMPLSVPDTQVLVEATFSTVAASQWRNRSHRIADAVHANPSVTADCVAR